MASTYLQKFPVPENFPELLSDLTKSILKEQPSDIIEYAYHYFRSLKEGKNVPAAEKKNYYGTQIKKQKKDGKAQVIPRPHQVEPESDHNEPSEKSQKSEKSGNFRSTQTTHKTEKMAADQFYEDLADEALEMYEKELERNQRAQNGRPHSSEEYQRVEQENANPRRRHRPIDEEEADQEASVEAPKTFTEAELRKQFDIIDRDKSGSPMSIEQIQNMFNLLDLNHDGKISFDEFQKINDGDGFKKSQGSMEYFTSAFHQLDKNKNGFLSLLELAQGLQMIGYDLTEGQVRSIFKQMDSNNDGSVDRIEFIKFMNFILKGAAVLAEVDPELEKLQKAFNIFDRDRSGFISIAEFQNFLAAKNCPLTLAQIRELFDKIDANLDGKISFEEFVAGMRKIDSQDNYAKDSNDLYRRIFQQLDKNSSGSLSIQEIAIGIAEFGYEVTKSQIEEIFQAMDRDQSGLVSLQEFTAFMKWLRGESRPTVHSSNQQPEIAEAVQENHGSSQVRPEIQKLRKTFNIIDKDQSGSISIREFQNYFATLNHPLSLAEIKELFNKMDENKDGRISFQEFIDGVQKLESESNSSTDSSEMYQKIFNKLDINSSGNLSISEVAMGLIEYGYEVTLQQIEEIFTLMDSSKNGLVSLQEFIAFMKWLRHEDRMSSLNKENAKLKKQFDLVDKDRSGYLTLGEVQSYLSCLGYPMILNEIKQLFELIDTNNDQKISFKEFVIGAKKVQSSGEQNPDPVHSFTKIFQAVDSNQNGSLSRKEVAEALIEFGYHITVDEINQLFTMVDLNEDGSISLDEFIKFMSTLQGTNSYQMSQAVPDESQMTAEEGIAIDVPRDYQSAPKPQKLAQENKHSTGGADLDADLIIQGEDESFHGEIKQSAAKINT